MILKYRFIKGYIRNNRAHKQNTLWARSSSGGGKIVWETTLPFALVNEVLKTKQQNRAHKQNTLWARSSSGRAPHLH